jgi:hypothetical protein
MKSSQNLARIAVLRTALRRAWQAGLDPDLDRDLTIDVDSTICETYGLKKQRAKFGYTKVRGYHPLLATPGGHRRGAARAHARPVTPDRRVGRAAWCAKLSAACATPGHGEP